MAKDDLDIKALQAEIDSLKREVEALQAELDQPQPEMEKMKELAARAQADLQNAKDRMEKEGAEIRKFALEGMIMKLLPTIDTFERAFKHLPDNLQDDEWVKGMSNVNQELMGALSELGLKRIDAVGQIVDPEKHEVLQTGPGEKDTVIEVFEEGYEYHGKVLRPAKVGVGEG